MEWQHMYVSASQNTVWLRLIANLSCHQQSFQHGNGYGPDANVEGSPKAALLSAWAKFYGQGSQGKHYFPSFEQALAEYEQGATTGDTGRPKFVAEWMSFVQHRAQLIDLCSCRNQSC